MRIKDQHKEKAIIDAAIGVFAKDGFFSSKIHKIADRAGVASGTIYLYFRNKELILFRIFDRAWEQLFEIVEPVHDSVTMDFEGKFNAMIDGVFDYFMVNPALTIVFVNEQNRLAKRTKDFTEYREKTMTLIENLTSQGIREGRLNPALNPAIFGAFFFGGLRFLLHQWAVAPKQYPLDVIRENIKKIIVHPGVSNFTISLHGKN